MHRYLLRSHRRRRRRRLQRRVRVVLIRLHSVNFNVRFYVVISFGLLPTGAA